MNPVHPTLRNPGMSLADHGSLMRKMAGMPEQEFLTQALPEPTPAEKTAAQAAIDIKAMSDEDLMKKIAEDPRGKALLVAQRDYGTLLGDYKRAADTGDAEGVKIAEANLAEFLNHALADDAQVEAFAKQAQQTPTAPVTPIAKSAQLNLVSKFLGTQMPAK